MSNNPQNKGEKLDNSTTIPPDTPIKTPPGPLQGDINALNYAKIGYPTKNGRKLTDQQHQVFKLLMEGKEIEEALKLAGYGEGSIDAMKTRYKKYLSTRPAFMEKTNLAMEKVVDEVIEGHKDASRSTAYNIWKDQQDRIDPKKKISVTATLNLVGDMEHLKQFQGTQEHTIDTTPPTTGSDDGE